MIMTLDFVREFVYQNFPKITTSKGGTHFHGRCVLCGDSRKSKSKKRFHLDFNNGEPVFHCWNCGASGTFATLYSQVKGISISQALTELNKFDPDQIAKTLLSSKPKVIENNIPEYTIHNNILKDCLGISDNPEGIIQTEYKKALLKFIEERKIPSEIQVYVAYQGEYKGRIIIPIFKGKDIVYFQGRSLEPNPDRKYKNPPITKDHIIYNLDHFQRDKYIIITEGLLDAMQISNQGTSMLGKVLSDNLVQTLLTLSDKGIIVAFDNDGDGKKALLSYLKEGKFSHRIKYFIIPSKYKQIKDLNDLSVKCNIGNIYDFVVNNSFSKFDTLIKVKIGLGGKSNENYTERNRLYNNK